MDAAPALAILCAVALGIVMGEGCAVTASMWAALSLLTLAMTWWARRRHQGTVVLACVCMMCAAAYRTRSISVAPFRVQGFDSTTASRPVRARMRLVGPVRLVTTDDGPHRLRVRARLLATAQDGLWRPCGGEVLLHLWPGAPVATGDTVLVPVRLRPAPKPRNIGEPTAARWASRSGLSGRAQVQGAHVVEAFGPFYLSGLDRWRQRCAAQLRCALQPAAAALARAMSLGDAAGLQTLVRQTWSDAGIAHLLSVSGMHLALVMGVVSAALRTCLRRVVWLQERYHLPHGAFVLSLMCGGCFAALSGDGWAALRALGMATVLGCGRMTGRRQTALQALALVGAWLLWLWPMALFDLGFEFSFTVVAALVLWAAPSKRAPKRSTKASVFRRTWAMLRESLRVCAVAQLASAPLCAHAFGQVACTAVLINVVAMPVASVAVVLGLWCALWGPAPTSLLARLTNQLLAMLHFFGHWASAWPGASIWAPRTAVLWYVACAALFVCLTVQMQGRSKVYRSWAKGATWLCALGVIVSYLAAFYAQPSNGRLQLDHLYVGQGDATLVTFPDGLTMLVDGGGVIGSAARDPGRLAVAPALDRLGIRRIDVMVLTHPHPDHLGGLLYIAERYPVRTLWLNGDGLGYRDVQTLVQSVIRNGGKVGPAPLHWDVQGVTLTSHAPLGGVWASANDHALVLKLVHGQRSVVLAGDIEGRAEALVADALGAVDLIKAGHHGSRTSSSRPLLRVLKPRGAIISCGEDNTFGFPHAETLKRLEAHHIAVWRTDLMGALHLETDGQSWQGRGVDGRAWAL